MPKIKKIDLEELFDNNFDCYTEYGTEWECIDEQPAITKEKFKELCISFGKQLLELAANKAELLNNGQKLGSNRYLISCGDTFHSEVEIDVDKESILNTINQIK